MSGSGMWKVLKNATGSDDASEGGGRGPGWSWCCAAAKACCGDCGIPGGAARAGDDLRFAEMGWREAEDAKPPSPALIWGILELAGNGRCLVVIVFLNSMARDDSVSL